VAPDSKAAEQGFRSGDVILKVNTDEVATPAEFAEAVAKAEEDERNAIVVLMSRGDNERFVALPLADA
jgi:serine protease Do